MEKTASTILETEQRAAVISKARTYLDLEKERINQLLTMLADFSTQAALLGGAAISSMGGESLDSLDDEHENHSVGAAIFVSSGALALATSLWVIFISSHLSSLTRDSSMRPKIIEARKILERGVHSVRSMMWVALASFLVSSTAIAWLNTTTFNSILFSIVLLVVVWQALLKKDEITDDFQADHTHRHTDTRTHTPPTYCQWISSRSLQCGPGDASLRRSVLGHFYSSLHRRTAATSGWRRR